MSKIARGFLAIAIVLTVYLIYVIGYVLYSPQAGMGYVFPFFHIQTVGEARALLNFAGGLSIISWILWGIGFISE